MMRASDVVETSDCLAGAKLPPASLLTKTEADLVWQSETLAIPG